jgi:predicted phosphodiesterase
MSATSSMSVYALNPMALPTMRALILSDIHSNIDALDAVLAAAPEHDVVWNLGDLVGYNAAPVAVMQRVREIGNIFVRGNHDRACSGLSDAENFNPIALATVRWTQRQLDDETTRWLREMPRGPIDPYEDEVNGRQVSCVHGSLLDEDQYLLSAEDAEEQPRDEHSRITFFGHTHIQGGFAANADGEWFRLKPVYTEDNDPESYELDLRESATYLVNPGSVGQPRDHDWRAAFALYDDNAERITFHRVPYDVRLAQMRIQRAGLPDMLGARLRVGR